MPDSPVPNETPAEKKIRKQAEQDQQMANDISAALTMMEAARDDADIQTFIGGIGYSPADIATAITDLQEPAQAAYNARQTAMGVAKRATENLGNMEKEERKDFSDYREIARAVYPASADQVALGLKGATPQDLQKFLTAAKSSYSAGKTAAFSAKLTKRGYSPAAIDAQLTGIKSVSDLSKNQLLALGAAQKATKTRDAAFDLLKAWVSEFRKIAKRVLRTRPDLLGNLAL